MLLNVAADARSTSELLQARGTPSSCGSQDAENDADDEGENTARYRRKPKATRASEPPDVYRPAAEDLGEKGREEQAAERVKSCEVSIRTEKAADRSVVKVDISDDRSGKDGRSRMISDRKSSGKKSVNEAKEQDQKKESVESKKVSTGSCRRRDTHQGNVPVLSETRKQNDRVKDMAGTVLPKEASHDSSAITETYAALDSGMRQETARKMSETSLKDTEMADRHSRREVPGNVREAARESDGERDISGGEEAMRVRAMTVSRVEKPRRAVSGRQKKSMSLEEVKVLPLALSGDKPLPSPVVEERPSPMQAFVKTKQ